MKAEERRKKITEIMRREEQPISASALAAQLSVSRQIIVGDIALLRAQGEQISATPRGYVIERGDTDSDGVIKRIAVKHTEAQMEQELNVYVDNGCRVLDVIVEHPIYGQLTGQLQLGSRYDVSQFMKKVRGQSAHALSELTDDIHLHTLQCPDEAAYERVCAALKEAGILYE